MGSAPFFKYAYPGPPFNWLGTFTLSQSNAFTTWVNNASNNSPDIELFYRIRAQQLRKSAGLLEKYYAGLTPPLAPTFQKTAWQPGPQGHWVQAARNDHLPMAFVNQIKGYLQPQFEFDDDAVFFMNHLRTLIERNEDEAQYASEIDSIIPTLLQQIASQFTQPEYQSVLVDDVNSSNMYKGQPYFRVNALDAPTQWELEQHSKSPVGGSTVQLQYTDTQAGQQ